MNFLRIIFYNDKKPRAFTASKYPQVDKLNNLGYLSDIRLSTKTKGK